MNPRRITLTLGAAAGGLLAAAFLPVAVAFADDDFTYNGDTLVPESTESVPVTSEGPLNLYETVSEQEIFTIDTPTSSNVGAIGAAETTWTTPFGISNEEIVVNQEGLGLDQPPLNSVFDTTNFGFGFENMYFDVPGSGGAADTITDTLVTPFGDFNIPI